ncbi:MAG TPA: lipid-A-disaccharide synthase [Vicinamibacterales bacterium]|nr:lipid-A-disaccharide synthase [Vicinamibacterales bacterium]
MIDTPGPRVLVSCGEASGDLYAGALVSALRSRAPGVRVSGFGGAALAGAGATLLGDYRGFAVTGLSEALTVLPRSWRMLRTIEAAARADRPDVFVAIDFPDFNFRLLPVLHGLGVPVVYYVSPQLWAWRAGRMKTLRRHVAKMLVIFPFEAAIYERAGVPVTFVGHPLVDLAPVTTDRTALARAHGLDPALPIVALLPGSRPNEVVRLLPVLVDAAGLICTRVPGAQFVVARAPALDDRVFEPVASTTRLPMAVISGDTDSVLAAADVAVTASGTATVQAALHGCPMVIVYKVSPSTYALGRRLVRVSTYGMANLVAGRPVVPELIQEACTPERVAGEAVSLLTDQARADAMRQDLADVRAKLGTPGASDRAAEAVLAAAVS